MKNSSGNNDSNGGALPPLHATLGSEFMTPEEHGRYWHDLAQERIADNARLRRALEDVLASATPNRRDNPAMFRVWASARAALNSQNDKVRDAG